MSFHKSILTMHNMLSEYLSPCVWEYREALWEGAPYLLLLKVGQCISMSINSKMLKI